MPLFLLFPLAAYERLTDTMLRRTILAQHKLIIVESPNKVSKITAILNKGADGGGVRDWTFGKASFKPVGTSAAAGGDQERAFVLPTVGHFLELRTLQFSNLPVPEAAPLVVSPVADVPPTPEPAVAIEEATPKGKVKKGRGKKAKADTAPPVAQEAQQPVPIVDVSIFSENAPLRHVTFDWAPQMGKDVASTLVSAVQENLPKLTEIILASDPDREGELIASHAHALLMEKLPKLTIPFSRAYIHSITEEGVLKAMEERKLHFVDRGLANAAETRHGMDRIFGFLGSSLVRHLNTNFRSIGRVQTPALIAVVEREQRIEAYLKGHRASFSIQANCSFLDAKGDATLERTVTLTEVKAGAEVDAVNQVAPLPEADAADQEKVDAHGANVKSVYLNALGMDKISHMKGKAPVVSHLSSAPPLPFAMATLISKANKSLRLSSEEVAKGLQELFQAGLITYPRTDSHRIDPSVVPSIRKAVEAAFGTTFVRSDDDVAKKSSSKKKKDAATEGNAEDAHEAIRPTDIQLNPEQLGAIDGTARKLYELIHATTLASFMTPMTQDKVSSTIEFQAGSGAVLSMKLEAKRVTHQGYEAAFGKTVLTPVVDDAAADGDNAIVSDSLYDAIATLPKRLGKAKLAISNAQVTKSKPSPPPQLTEGSLIDYLKDRGVGRPSTYPTIMKTLLARGYVVVNSKGRLETTQIGRELAATTQRVFPALVDIGFTAEFEAKLDRIARAVTATESASSADLVLSAFLVELLRFVKSSAEARRREILEKSITTRMRHTHPDWEQEQVCAAVAQSIQESKMVLSDIFALTKASQDFTQLQRTLERFLSREFPSFS